jgi:hypothetical protein
MATATARQQQEVIWYGRSNRVTEQTKQSILILEESQPKIVEGNRV